jgi:hypothetical protein
MAIYRRVGRLKLFSSRCNGGFSSFRLTLSSTFHWLPIMLVGKREGNILGHLF